MHNVAIWGDGMIVWDDEKNQKLQIKRDISFDQISEIILRKEYFDILENPSRPNQQIFVVRINDYIHSVPFIIDDQSNIVLKTAYPSRKLQKKYEGGKIMEQKLDNYEKEIENNISQFSPVSNKKKELIDGIIDQANTKKVISLRLKANDLELLKHRADSEGLPYQTLLSSIVHKFVSDQLVDKRSVLKSLEILKST